MVRGWGWGGGGHEHDNGEQEGEGRPRMRTLESVEGMGGNAGKGRTMKNNKGEDYGRW